MTSIRARKGDVANDVASSSNLDGYHASFFVGLSIAAFLPAASRNKLSFCFARATWLRARLHFGDTPHGSHE